MAPKPKKPNKRRIVEQQKQRVDDAARYLQAVAIVAVVIVVIVGQVIKGADRVPIWVTAGLMGVAIGLSPEQFVEIIKSFLRGRTK